MFGQTLWNIPSLPDKFGGFLEPFFHKTSYSGPYIQMFWCLYLDDF